MKLSTKSRYAVSSLMELAISGPGKPITLSDLAAKQGISLSYAEQLFAGLREHKLVKGTRGPGGGFILAREPNTIGEQRGGEQRRRSGERNGPFNGHESSSRPDQCSSLASVPRYDARSSSEPSRLRAAPFITTAPRSST